MYGNTRTASRILRKGVIRGTTIIGLTGLTLNTTVNPVTFLHTTASSSSSSSNESVSSPVHVPDTIVPTNNDTANHQETLAEAFLNTAKMALLEAFATAASGTEDSPIEGQVATLAETLVRMEEAKQHQPPLSPSNVKDTPTETIPDTSSSSSSSIISPFDEAVATEAIATLSTALGLGNNGSSSNSTKDYDKDTANSTNDPLASSSGTTVNFTPEVSQQLDQLLQDFVHLSGKIAEVATSTSSSSSSPTNTILNDDIDNALLAATELLAQERTTVLNHITQLMQPLTKEFSTSSSSTTISTLAEPTVPSSTTSIPSSPVSSSSSSSASTVPTSNVADVPYLTSEGVAAIVAAERARIEAILEDERRRIREHSQVSDQTINDIRQQLRSIQQSITQRVDEGRTMADQALQWAQQNVGALMASGVDASEQVQAAKQAAVNALQHAKEAQEISVRSGKSIEQAMLAQAASAAEVIVARTTTEQALVSAQQAQQASEASAAAAFTAAQEAQKARTTADMVIAQARTASTEAQLAKEAATAALKAAAEAVAESRASRADTSSVIEILRMAVAAAGSAAASARVAEETALARAGELAVAAHRADLLAQVATARAEALAAISTATDTAQRITSDINASIANAEATKARSAAEAVAAIRAAETAKRRSEEEKLYAESIVTSVRKQTDTVLNLATKEMETTLQRLRTKEEGIREHSTQEIQKLRQAEYDAKLAQLLATEKAASALALAETHVEAAKTRIAEIRTLAEAQTRTALAESDALAAKAAEEARVVAEEALLAQGLANELIAQSRAAIQHAQEEANHITLTVKQEADEATRQAREQAQRLREQMEQEAQQAITKADQARTQAKQQIDQAVKEINDARARAEQERRIAETAVEIARYQARHANKYAKVPTSLKGGEDVSFSVPETEAITLAENLVTGNVPSTVSVPSSTTTNVATTETSTVGNAFARLSRPLSPYEAGVVRIAKAAQNDKEISAQYQTNVHFDTIIVPEILQRMNLKDTPTNRQRVLRYIETFGIDTVRQHLDQNKGSGSKVSSKNHIVPLPNQGGPFDSYIHSLLKVTEKTAPVSKTSTKETKGEKGTTTKVPVPTEVYNSVDDYMKLLGKIQNIPEQGIVNSSRGSSSDPAVTATTSAAVRLSPVSAPVQYTPAEALYLDMLPKTLVPSITALLESSSSFASTVPTDGVIPTTYEASRTSPPSSSTVNNGNSESSYLRMLQQATATTTVRRTGRPESAPKDSAVVSGTPSLIPTLKIRPPNDEVSYLSTLQKEVQAAKKEAAKRPSIIYPPTVQTATTTLPRTLATITETVNGSDAYLAKMSTINYLK